MGHLVEIASAVIPLGLLLVPFIVSDEDRTDRAVRLLRAWRQR